MKYRIYDKDNKIYLRMFKDFKVIGIDAYFVVENNIYKNCPENDAFNFDVITWVANLDNQDRFVVERFTELFDKNDKKIYEGDLLYFQYNHEFNGWSESIDFEVQDKLQISSDLYGAVDVVVTGTIHDEEED